MENMKPSQLAVGDETGYSYQAFVIGNDDFILLTANGNMTGMVESANLFDNAERAEKYLAEQKTAKSIFSAPDEFMARAKVMKVGIDIRFIDLNPQSSARTGTDKS